MLSISFIHEYIAASLTDIENEHTIICKWIKFISHTNKEKIVLCSVTLFIRIMKT
jgi:hypothetical protein